MPRRTPLFVLVTGLLLAAGPVPAQSPVTIGEHVPETFETLHPYVAAESVEPTLTTSHYVSFPGATYIAPHFAEFELAPGDYVIVRSPDGEQSWRYEGLGKRGLGRSADGFFAAHIRGDLAVVELWTSRAERGDVEHAYGYRIDYFGRGYNDDEIEAFWDQGLGEVMNLPYPPSQLRSLCGTDDSEEAKCYLASEPGAYDTSRAVARLMLNGNAHCTGWLIGCEGHLMTNQHCIGSQSTANNIDFEFMAEGASCATDCRTTLGCPGTIEASGGTLVAVDSALDYALVIPDTSTANNTDLPATYGYMRLRDSGPVLNERIYIPQHPAGWGKRIALESTHTADGGFAHIVSLNENGCQSAAVSEAGYYADTQGGSSGSPVLGYSDDRVVALHHCRGSFACTGTGGDPNRGVPIDLIIADLGAARPDETCGGGSADYALGTVTSDEQLRTQSVSGVSSPRVVMGPASYNGSHPGVLRVRNVTGSSFQHEFQEWEYLDGNHANETVGYLAFGAGRSTLGSLDVEAGSVDTDHNWVSVTFSSPFPSTPVVIPQVATFNGGQAAATRIRNVSTTGFDVRLQEEEALGSHVVETIHWLAVEVGSATVGGNTFVVGRTGNSVTDAWSTIGFGQSLSNPVFVAAMQTFDGSDPATVRYRNLTSSNVEVHVDEEQSNDSETGHTTEVVGYVAVSR